MNRTAPKSGGFTLVEVMVALLILLFVSVALMQTALVSIDSNMRNVLRDEAVRLAEKTVSDVRTTPFSHPSLDVGVHPPTKADLKLRGFTGASATEGKDFFTIKNTVVDLNNDNNKRVDVLVQWTWKGLAYNTTISTTRSRQP
ncbi:MAG: type II secretion system protein [Nitrospirota bacterium]|jgi:prepilin-type N-terminal cleavage/methylation domain-containing protein